MEHYGISTKPQPGPCWTTYQTRVSVLRQRHSTRLQVDADRRRRRLPAPEHPAPRRRHGQGLAALPADQERRSRGPNARPSSCTRPRAARWTPPTSGTCGCCRKATASISAGPNATSATARSGTSRDCGRGRMSKPLFPHQHQRRDADRRAASRPISASTWASARPAPSSKRSSCARPSACSSSARPRAVLVWKREISLWHPGATFVVVKTPADLAKPAQLLHRHPRPDVPDATARSPRP